MRLPNQQDGVRGSVSVAKCGASQRGLMALAEACELHPAIHTPTASRSLIITPLSSPTNMNDNLFDRTNRPPTPIMSPKKRLTPKSTPDPEERQHSLLPQWHSESEQAELPFHHLFAPSPSHPGRNASNSRASSHRPETDAPDAEAGSPNINGQVAPVARMFGHTSRINGVRSDSKTRRVGFKDRVVQDCIESDSDDVKETDGIKGTKDVKETNAAKEKTGAVSESDDDSEATDFQEVEETSIAISSPTPTRTTVAVPEPSFEALPSSTDSLQTFARQGDTVHSNSELPCTNSASSRQKSKKHAMEDRPNVTTRSKRQKLNGSKDEILDTITVRDSTPIVESGSIASLSSLKGALRDAGRDNDVMTASPPKYIIHRLLKKRVFNKKVWYLVEWKGYPKCKATWEPENQIRKDVTEGDSRNGAIAAWRAMKATLPSRRRR
ncbi:hypothetical protein K440DRAFT_619318 [Wilcoxina mikolae CBS 423.85]|nr:hypothetical protein K440DRAFT_619318 [Wilcoxina mikolae CBS 423.85]